MVTDPLAVPTLSAISVVFIQWLKKSSWFPWLSDESSKVSLRIVSGLTAFATAAGLHWTYNDGTLTITGLTLMAVATALWAWLKQMVFNELIFQGAVKAPGNAAVAASVATPKVLDSGAKNG